MRYMVINKFPFLTEWKSFELVSAKKSYNLGIMLTSQRVDNAFELLNIYFSFTLLLTIAVSVISINLLFNWLILKRRNVFAYNEVIPIVLSQATNLQVHRHARFYRLAVATVVWFYFLIMATFSCFLTSQIVSYIPDERIGTIEDLIEKNISVFCQVQIQYILQNERFGFSDEFIDRIQTNNNSIWAMPETSPKSAYVVDMVLQDHYLQSATNLNNYGRPKYYKFKKLIASLPFFYLLPIHSPLVDEFGRMLSIINEAGLDKHWELTEFASGRVPHFRKFATKSLNIQLIPQGYKEFSSFFLIFFVGHGISIITFLCELLWYYCWPRGRV